VPALLSPMKSQVFWSSVMQCKFVILPQTRGRSSKGLRWGGIHLQSAISKLDAERAEVDAVLSSGVFGRTNNHVRLRAFVCEKYLKERSTKSKSTASQCMSLGRPESFDPQLDTIVRVTAHALRKRLEDYYTSAGADHSVHICLRPATTFPSSSMQASWKQRLNPDSIRSRTANLKVAAPSW